MQTVTNNIELLKIIVPAIASFLGALLAGIIAIVTSILSSKLAYKNALKTVRQNSIIGLVSESYQTIVELITHVIIEKRVLNENEVSKIVSLLLWVDDEVVKQVRDILQEQDKKKFITKADSLINKIRSLLGVCN